MVPRGGGRRSSHRREQSGSVGEGRLDGRKNSRRLAGHSTAAISKVLKVTDDVAARSSNTATIKDGRRGRVAARQQQESEAKKTRQGRRAEDEGTKKETSLQIEKREGNQKKSKKEGNGVASVATVRSGVATCAGSDT